MRYFSLNSNASHPLKCAAVSSTIGRCQSVGIRVLCVALNHAPFKGGEKTVIEIREQCFVKITTAGLFLVRFYSLPLLFLQYKHTPIYIPWYSFHLIGAPQDHGFAASEMTRCSFCHILDWNGHIPYVRKFRCGDKKLCRNGITLLLEQTHALI